MENLTENQKEQMIQQGLNEIYNLNRKKERMPKIGEVVLFTSNPNDDVAKSNYNDDRIPAIVTRVWSHGCINIKIIPDCGPVQDRTSVVHKSLNSAGYHFEFMDEVYPEPIDASKVVFGNNTAA